MDNSEYENLLLKKIFDGQEIAAKEIIKISNQVAATREIVAGLEKNLISRIETIEQTGLQRFQIAMKKVDKCDEFIKNVDCRSHAERITALEKNKTELSEKIESGLASVTKKNEDQDRERMQMILGGIKWVGGIIAAVIGVALAYKFGIK